MSKNVLIWIDGNLAYDPQLRQVGTKNVCNFTVATSVGTKKEDGTTNTNFFECSAWSKNGEWLFSKMQKTTGVTVFGTFEAVEVVNPATGEKRIKNRVNAISVKLRYLNYPLLKIWTKKILLNNRTQWRCSTIRAAPSPSAKKKGRNKNG